MSVAIGLLPEARRYHLNVEWVTPQVVPFVLPKRRELLDSLMGLKPRAEGPVTENSAEVVPGESLKAEGTSAETDRSLLKSVAGHHFEGRMEMLNRTTSLIPLLHALVMAGAQEQFCTGAEPGESAPGPGRDEALHPAAQKLVDLLTKVLGTVSR